MQHELANSLPFPRQKLVVSLREQLIKCIVTLIVIFSFTTMVQSLIDSISINKVVGALLVVASIFLYFISFDLKSITILIVFVPITIISFVSSLDISKDANDYLFLFATIFTLINLTNSRNVSLFKKTLYGCSKMIALTAIFECIILAILLVTRTGYYGHWGEGVYFRGLCNSQHTMASLSCLILSFLIFRVKFSARTKLLYVVLGLIPSLAIFESGARVFLFPLAILLFCLVRLSFSNRILRVLIYLLGIILGIILITKSSMMDKFIFTTENIYAVNVLSAFTSGRSEFWKVDLIYFTSGSPFQLLFGRSFSAVYAINLEKVNLEIWAHNDLIHLLVGTGIIGTLAYVSIFYGLFKQTFNRIKSKTDIIALILYIIVPMLLNGFFTYQHFTYSFFILFLTLLNNEKRRIEL